MILAEITTHSNGINWDAVGAIAGPILVVVGAVSRWIARKIDMVGKHLSRQDHDKRDLALRIGRIEEKLGMLPMKLNGTAVEEVV